VERRNPHEPHSPAPAEEQGIFRLGRSGFAQQIAPNSTLYLAVAIGLVAALVLAGLASELVHSVKRHFEQVDRAHPVIIDLIKLAAALQHVEHLRHHLISDRAIPHEDAYVAASEHAASAIIALQRRLPANSPSHAKLRDLLSDMEAERAGLLPSGSLVKQHIAPGLRNAAAVAAAYPSQDLLIALGRNETLELGHSELLPKARLERIEKSLGVIAAAACLSSALLLAFVLWRRMAAPTLANSENVELQAKQRTAELEATNQLLHQFSAYIEAAREEERRRIAREVHDVLGSTLTALKIELSGSYAVGFEGGRHRRQRRAAAELADSALETVNDVVSRLRPSVLEKFGLWEALKCHVEQFQTRSNIACRLVMASGLPSPSCAKALGIFRIVEEMLTNVARHAAASSAEISIGMDAGTLEVKVTDNGRGITESEILSPRSFGLLSMHERAELMGGRFCISRLDSASGTLGCLRMPLRAVYDSSQN